MSKYRPYLKNMFRKLQGKKFPLKPKMDKKHSSFLKLAKTVCNFRKKMCNH